MFVDNGRQAVEMGLSCKWRRKVEGEEEPRTGRKVIMGDKQGEKQWGKAVGKNRGEKSGEKQWGKTMA